MEKVAWAIAATLAAAVIALGVVEVVHRVVRRLGRRSGLLAELSERSHRPFQVAAAVAAVHIAVRIATGYAAKASWHDALLHGLGLVVIASTAWLVASLLLVTQDAALARFRMDVPDNRQVRRIRTQIVMLRRVTIAVIVILTLGVMLMTFPNVRGVGASVLASAGVIGAIAALAAQSVLGNVVAGLQLAFSDAVRLDDVVVVEGEWGRVEELTLSYVVVQIWDDRRLILPTSYFTTKPFQNWTRTSSAVLGTAEFDVDWSVPVQDMRDELRRLVEGSKLWDGRTCVLQVTDATGGTVRLRALVSAADAPSLWDLRCLVREQLIGWIRDRRPTALPRMRAEVGGGEAPDWQSDGSRGRAVTNGGGPHGDGVRADKDGAWTDRRVSRTGEDDARMFGGSADGDARGTNFVGPEEPVEPAR